MAWSGDCSDYEEEDDGEATGTDIEDLPVEELIVVLRDEQNSIKEAQRLIHKEIKSIRRELRRLLRQYAAGRSADPNGGGALGPDASADSGLGETHYDAPPDTANEPASSQGDSEAGYRCDADNEESAGRGRSPGIAESGAGLVRTGKDEADRRAGELQGQGARAGLASGPGEGPYGIPGHWGGGVEAALPLEDHTRGRNSTYEDAYSMMRRRHSQMELAEGGPAGGSRWRSMIHKHGKKIHSISEAGKHPQHRADPPTAPPLREHASRQSSDDELGPLQNYSDHRHARDDQHYSSPGLKTNAAAGHRGRRVPRRSQSAQVIDTSDVMPMEPPINGGPKDHWSGMPVLQKTQATQFLLRPRSRANAPLEPPPGQGSELRHSDPYRVQALSSEDEHRQSPGLSDSSYDSYASVDSRGFARSSHSSTESPRPGDRYPQHMHPTDAGMLQIVRQTQSSPVPSLAGASTGGPRPAPARGAYTDPYTDLPPPGYGSPNHHHHHHHHHNGHGKPRVKQRAKFLRNVGRSSSQPIMNVHEVMSNGP